MNSHYHGSHDASGPVKLQQTVGLRHKTSVTVGRLLWEFLRLGRKYLTARSPASITPVYRMILRCLPYAFKVVPLRPDWYGSCPPSGRIVARGHLLQKPSASIYLATTSGSFPISSAAVFQPKQRTFQLKDRCTLP